MKNDNVKYKIAKDGQDIGELTLAEIMTGLQNGDISPNDYCWGPEFTEWKTVQEALLNPKDIISGYMKNRWLTHFAACILGALAWGLVNYFIKVPGEVVEKQKRLETTSVKARPSEARRFERPIQTPIKLAPARPSNNGPFRISGCIASKINHINFSSRPIRVNDELPDSNMFYTFEDMEKICIEKQDWNNGIGALALTVLVENKSRYVINSPIISAVLVDENGAKIASGSYTGQSGAQFVTLAPGDRACYLLVIKSTSGNSREEKDLILSKFRKVEFSMYVGSNEVDLTQSQWVEPTER